MLVSTLVSDITLWGEKIVAEALLFTHNPPNILSGFGTSDYWILPKDLG